MTTVNITNKFARQSDGTWKASVEGFKGKLRIVHSDPLYKWTRIFAESNGVRKTVDVRFGSPVSIPVDVPCTSKLDIVLLRKPIEATITAEAENFADSVAQQISTGEGGTSSPDALLKIRQELDEQKRLNEEQQKQIDQNAADDAEQQRQIDANTELNEAQEKGIGEEAANDIVQSVFGAKS